MLGLSEHKLDFAITEDEQQQEEMIETQWSVDTEAWSCSPAITKAKC
jgi:hypothetical protein